MYKMPRVKPFVSMFLKLDELPEITFNISSNLCSVNIYFLFSITLFICSLVLGSIVKPIAIVLRKGIRAFKLFQTAPD